VIVSAGNSDWQVRGMRCCCEQWEILPAAVAADEMVVCGAVDVCQGWTTRVLWQGWIWKGWIYS
jgi:hypothetical protein